MNPYTDHVTLPEEPKKRRRWTKPLAYGGTALLGVLVGAGAAGAGNTDLAAEPAEPETITETVTEEVQVEVPVLPDQCRTAFDEADQLLLLSSDAMIIMADGFGLAGQAIEAAGAWDYETLYDIDAELETILSDLEYTNSLIEQSDYATNRDACLAAAP